MSPERNDRTACGADLATWRRGKPRSGRIPAGELRKSGYPQSVRRRAAGAPRRCADRHHGNNLLLRVRLCRRRRRAIAFLAEPVCVRRGRGIASGLCSPLRLGHPVGDRCDFANAPVNIVADHIAFAGNSLELLRQFGPGRSRSPAPPWHARADCSAAIPIWRRKTPSMLIVCRLSSPAGRTARLPHDTAGPRQVVVELGCRRQQPGLRFRFDRARASTSRARWARVHLQSVPSADQGG